MSKTGKYWSPCNTSLEMANCALCTVARDIVRTYVTFFVAIVTSKSKKKEEIVLVRLWFNKTIIDSPISKISRGYFSNKDLEIKTLSDKWQQPQNKEFLFCSRRVFNQNSGAPALIPWSANISDTRNSTELRVQGQVARNPERKGHSNPLRFANSFKLLTKMCLKESSYRLFLICPQNAGSEKLSSVEFGRVSPSSQALQQDCALKQIN